MSTMRDGLRKTDYTRVLEDNCLSHNEKSDQKVQGCSFRS